ncbi:TadE/TadG family type IV pilus assembly protein [Jiangella mangrovi]|uniref:Flp pilus assembly protein TadG n=1 Tax=Jiangella mangrovi TaxID=1524084 RepID=A0A7W9LKV4_9ACTN|nr:TadE/TadG family type IV pilus assembly protein [Jiangella mangrovi]MBB5787452.1 Flp pilus assembly protein TadG [Jiangella mangrovi]
MGLRRSERGSATLETVVLWPAVFLLIFGIVHAGLWFHARNVALSAAREGARAASVDGGSGGAERAADFLASTTDDSVLRVRDIREAAGTDVVTVTVIGSSTTLIPGWRVDVSQTATAPIRRWSDP